MTPENPDWSLLPHRPEAFFGLDRNWDHLQLKRAYTSLIKIWKPGKFDDEFKRIRTAYEQLDQVLRNRRRSIETDDADEEFNDDVPAGSGYSVQDFVFPSANRDTQASLPPFDPDDRRPPSELAADLGAEAAIRILRRRPDKVPGEWLALAMLSSANPERPAFDVLLRGLIESEQATEEPCDLLRQWTANLVTTTPDDALASTIRTLGILRANGYPFYLVSAPLWERWYAREPTTCLATLGLDLSMEAHFHTQDEFTFILRFCWRNLFRLPPSWIRNQLDRMQACFDLDLENGYVPIDGNLGVRPWEDPRQPAQIGSLHGLLGRLLTIRELLDQPRARASHCGALLRQLTVHYIDGDRRALADAWPRLAELAHVDNAEWPWDKDTDSNAILSWIRDLRSIAMHLRDDLGIQPLASRKPFAGSRWVWWLKSQDELTQLRSNLSYWLLLNLLTGGLTLTIAYAVFFTLTALVKDNPGLITLITAGLLAVLGGFIAASFLSILPFNKHTVPLEAPLRFFMKKWIERTRARFAAKSAQRFLAIYQNRRSYIVARILGRDSNAYQWLMLLPRLPINFQQNWDRDRHLQAAFLSIYGNAP